MTVHISPGNSKMGAIPSVSLPAVITCRPDAPCYAKCYARRLELFRKSVRESYMDNYDLYKSDPDTYWREVEGAVMMNRFFRFHVSGDIPDLEYFVRMIGMADRNPHCEILCFTKRYRFVNAFLNETAKCEGTDKPVLPKNLHIIFSAWKGLEMENPWNLPEAHVAYKDGTTTARADAIPCGGNCTTCAKTNGGCWSLKNGEQLVIHEH